MKPAPIITPAPRALNYDERLLLEVSAAGGGYAFKPGTQRMRNLARGLVRMGLGQIEGGLFAANASGMAAVKHTC